MRYSGKFGFAESTEVAPGVWEDVITERDYLGYVQTRTETFHSVGLHMEPSVLPQYRTTVSVSVLSDGVLKEHYSDLRYVTYLGKRWTVGSIVVEEPRMVIHIGEMYNGPTQN